MNFKEWNANYRLAAGLALALMVWMVTGFISGKKQEAKDAQENQESEELFLVQAKESFASEYILPIYARGRTEANRSVDVAAEVDGQVLATPAKEGSLVKKGDPLCVLDSQDRKLRLEQSIAQRDKAQIDFEGALRLKNGGYQSKTQIAEAKANLAIAQTELKASSLTIERLTIRAPFDGVVQQRLIDAGAYVQSGTACARLIELSPLLITAHVAESDVMHLHENNTAKVKFLDGSEHLGKVRYISKVADSNTRTFKIDVEIANEDYQFVDGLSAELEVLTSTVSAHLINPSLLALVGDGVIAVKTLDEKNIVRQVTVELVGDSANGVWITGLPEKVTLITVGQEYVSVGSQVAVQKAGSKTSVNVSAGSAL